jgi:hypothetical protein
MSRPDVDDPRWAWKEYADELQAENAKLRELLAERDGGTHDADCKINRPAIKRCNCGHDEVMTALGGKHE